MRFTNSVLAVASALFLVSSLSAQTPAPAQAPAQPKPAASDYDRALLKPAHLKEKAPDTFQVKFETTKGDFVMDVTRAWAPNGADRFYNLVRNHFYDNMVIFRVVPNFVVQFGISSYPPVNAAWLGDTITDDPVKQSNKRGYVTFAKAGANSRTTQIFISFKDNSRLDAMGFAPFATVNKDGMKVVEKFYDQYADAPTNEQDAMQREGKPYLDKHYPKLDVIKHATIVGPAAAAAPALPRPTSNSGFALTSRLRRGCACCPHSPCLKPVPGAPAPCRRFCGCKHRRQPVAHFCAAILAPVSSCRWSPVAGHRSPSPPKLISDR